MANPEMNVNRRFDKYQELEYHYRLATGRKSGKHVKRASDRATRRFYKAEIRSELDELAARKAQEKAALDIDYMLGY